MDEKDRERLSQLRKELRALFRQTRAQDHKRIDEVSNELAEIQARQYPLSKRQE